MDDELILAELCPTLSGHGAVLGSCAPACSCAVDSNPISRYEDGRSVAIEGTAGTPMR